MLKPLPVVPSLSKPLPTPGVARTLPSTPNTASPQQAARPPPAPPVFRAGDNVQAKFTGDGQWYAAVVKEVTATHYLVSYPEFNNDEEWLPKKDVKKPVPTMRQ